MSSEIPGKAENPWLGTKGGTNNMMTPFKRYSIPGAWEGPLGLIVSGIVLLQALTSVWRYAGRIYEVQNPHKSVYADEKELVRGRVFLGCTCRI